MHPSTGDQAISLLIIAAFIAICAYRYRWKGSGTAFGASSWMSDQALRAWGFLSGSGLILGRTFKGALIRLPRYCHILLVGCTGSGKGVSILLPNLFSYRRGSIICFDTKSDLFANSGKRRAAWGERNLRLAPFDGGKEAFNPLASIPRDSPMLVDSARAMAEALVVRQGTEPDPYWNDKSVQVICAILVLVLVRFPDEERNLNSVQEVVSDPDMLKAAVERLRELGGVPARLGSQLNTLFDKQTTAFTKEGASVLSCVTRHLSFLDSNLVANVVATSTFDPATLRNPGTTLFIQIGPDQLEAQKGLLRFWLASLIRAVCAVGDEQNSEVLFLLDEAEALEGLPALGEMLVRGRSSGCRSILAYQSPSQVTAAFKDKPTLIYDNCDVQIHMGAASSYESAERLSKTIGDFTQVLESYGETDSWQPGSVMGQSGRQQTRTRSHNFSEAGRALLRPEEILQLDNDCLIVVQRGMSPILAKRVKWYQDPEFNPAVATKQRYAWLRQYAWLQQYSWLWEPPPWKVQLIVAGVLSLIVLALLNRVNH